MPTVRIQEKNYSESIMVLKLKDGFIIPDFRQILSVCPAYFAQALTHILYHKRKNEK